MRIFVKAKPGSRKPSLEKIDESHFVICVREAARENEANFAVMEALAEHCGVPFSKVRLIAGRTSSNKIFEITAP